MLKVTRNSVIAFDFKDALSFEGETGPYIQYAVVRIRNIFRKGGNDARSGVSGVRGASGVAELAQLGHSSAATRTKTSGRSGCAPAAVLRFSTSASPHRSRPISPSTPSSSRRSSPTSTTAITSSRKRTPRAKRFFSPPPPSRCANSFARWHYWALKARKRCRMQLLALMRVEACFAFDRNWDD